MIHYHGLPITPATAACAAVKGGHAFVSFRYADQLGLALEVCQSFAVDNGAFSAWKSGKPVTDWAEYYAWVAEIHRSPSFDFAVIPDVIDGDEEANDALLCEWPWQARHANVGAPVWHMHESIEHGLPVTKLHGLRMLNPEIFTRLPLSSADSTNIAQNIGIDSAWRGTYLPPSKDVRALVMRERIEQSQSARYWERQPVQMVLAA